MHILDKIMYTIGDIIRRVCAFTYIVITYPLGSIGIVVCYNPLLEIDNKRMRFITYFTKCNYYLFMSTLGIKEPHYLGKFLNLHESQKKIIK